MKRITIAIIMLLLTATTGFALTAQEVLDKCAAVVSARDGATASFSMTSAQYGNSQGTIAIKGQKFYMKSAETTMWFDGRTLWTYMADNDEVNISTPTQQQLQTLNPYNFINLYKQGYTFTMTTSGQTHKVHLTATNSQSKIKEGFITVNKTTYAPVEIQLLQGNKWTTFSVSNFKAERQDDTKFRFDATAYPDAELIDLR